jgi:hypothetical protein
VPSMHNMQRDDLKFVNNLNLLKAYGEQHGGGPGCCNVPPKVCERDFSVIYFSITVPEWQSLCAHCYRLLRLIYRIYTHAYAYIRAYISCHMMMFVSILMTSRSQPYNPLLYHFSSHHRHQYSTL